MISSVCPEVEMLPYLSPTVHRHLHHTNDNDQDLNPAFSVDGPFVGTLDLRNHC